MPVACNSNALTGSSGAVYYVLAGTKACLLAADFADAGVITVSSTNDFRVGDPITLTVTGGAVLDTAYADAAVVSAVDYSKNEVTVTQADGTAIGTLSGNGADNGGHVEMQYDPAQGICECREWSDRLFPRAARCNDPALARLVQLLVLLNGRPPRSSRAALPRSLEP